MIHHASQIALLFVGAVFLGAVAGVLYQFVGRYFIGYRLRPNHVEIITLGLIPFWRIAYRNIADVREMRFRSFRDFVNPTMFGRHLFALKLGNRVFGRGVLIELKSGIFRAVFISPNDPSEFITELHRRLPAALPEGGQGDGE